MRLKFIILAAILALASCTPQNELQAELLSDDVISIRWKGSTVIEYNPKSFQQGYNDTSHEYRIFKDDLSAWFTLGCSEKPVSEGQSITADLQWKTGSQPLKSFKGLKMVTKKADDSGLIWLWNDTNSIGIIIKNQ